MKNMKKRTSTNQKEQKEKDTNIYQQIAQYKEKE
jgi:hypothetical protein